jgi:hypothetical protein|tara:strand:+ start:302 stop:982 length:681 start_codon:yes stop_codon:yes gene_type:complete
MGAGHASVQNASVANKGVLPEAALGPYTALEEKVQELYKNFSDANIARRSGEFFATVRSLQNTPSKEQEFTDPKIFSVDPFWSSKEDSERIKNRGYVSDIKDKQVAFVDIFGMFDVVHLGITNVKQSAKKDKDADKTAKEAIEHSSPKVRNSCLLRIDYNKMMISNDPISVGEDIFIKFSNPSALQGASFVRKDKKFSFSADGTSKGANVEADTGKASEKHESPKQ